MTLTYRGQQYAQHNAPAAGTVMLTYRGKHYGQQKAVATNIQRVGTYRGARFEK